MSGFDLKAVREKAVAILAVFNVILVLVAWMMSLYSYPRLPQEIPLWIDLSGHGVGMSRRSLLFFLSPCLQILILAAGVIISRRLAKRYSDVRRTRILKESVFLALIFLQLIFIHIQRGLIFLAFHPGAAINPLYFYSLFLILLVLIPYFRIRLKLAARL